ncbi:MAG: ATP-binding protein [Candidatus Woesearchaeota archaeon]
MGKKKKLTTIVNQGKKLFRAIPDAAYIATFSGKIVARNDRFLELFELEPEETHNMCLDDLTDDSNTRNKFVELLKKSQDGKVTSYEEVLITRKTGNKIICEVTASIMGETRESPGDQYYFGLVRNITARRRYEEALSQASKLESLGILVGGIAHDFNNLLTGPFAYLDLIMSLATDGELDESKVIDYASRSLQALSNAKELVRQLLDYSKPSNANLERVNINEYILTYIGMIKDITLKSCEIRQDIEIREMIVLGNRSKVYQILQNLIINARDAIEATERKDGEIVVSTEYVELNTALTINHPRTKDDLEIPIGRYVKISVSDNGCGIKSDILDRIYDPFFTTKQRGTDTGTGLGLANVTSLVKAHNGYIN